MRNPLASLSVHDRAAESIVGLLVAVGARGTFRLSGDHAADPWGLVLVSLGATVTWAVIDAALSLMAAKGSRLRWSHLTRSGTAKHAKGREWVEEALDQGVLAGLDLATQRRIRRHVIEEAAHAGPASSRLTREDWARGAGIFAVVLLAGIPAILPFLVIPDPEVAAHVSNGVTLAMLFAFGLAWGPEHGLPRLPAAFAMLGLGAALVVAVVLLGG